VMDEFGELSPCSERALVKQSSTSRASLLAEAANRQSLKSSVLELRIHVSLGITAHQVFQA
jgi:hypothetical protein